MLLSKFIYRSGFTLLLCCLCLSENARANVENSSLYLAQQSVLSDNTETSEPNVLVAEVVIKGTEGKFLDLVKQTANIKPGGTTTRSGLQKDINAILATGYFSNVQVIPEDGAKGVRITFVVVMNPVLRRVELIGNTLVPAKTVNDIFSQQYNNVLNLGTLQANIGKLNKWYQDNGYISAQVATPKVSENGIVQLPVTEGVVEDIQVRFVDKYENEKDSKGQAITGKTPPAAILKRMKLKTGQVFYRPQVEKDLQNILKLGVFDNANVTFNTGKDNQKVIVLVNIFENDLASNVKEFIQLQEELETAQTNKNLLEEAKILRKLGYLYTSSKAKYQTGIEKYQAALKILQSEKDVIGAAKIYNKIGNAYYKYQEYDKAISNYQNALKNYESKQEKLGKAIVTNNIGNTYLQSKEYDKAVDSYNQAQQSFAKLNQPFWQAMSLSNLAFSYYYSNNKDKSIETYIQAILLWKNLKNKPQDTNIKDNTKLSESSA